MTSRTFRFAILSLLLCTTMAMAEERHLGPHVHGQASLNLSVDGSTVQGELSIPGHDAVGFEHPAGSADERKAVTHARDVLTRAAWFQPSASAQCKLTGAKVQANGFDGAAAPGGHADFDADYTFHCDAVDKLDHVDVRLADAFPGLQKIVVDIVTGAGANQQVLERGVVRVDIAP